MDITLGTPLRLGHLPLVMDVLRRTGLLSVIDQAVADDRRSKVSTAECVAVILCGVFVGEHGLWRMRERLSPYDMRTIMQDAGFDLAEFPEERLAKALDDLFAADLDRLMSGVALQAIRQFTLATDFLQFDTTSLSFFGAYEREGIDEAYEGILPPKVVRGYSKDHRPDLKQVVFGSVVTADGGVPLWGKVLDGNCADSTAAAEFFARVRDVVADPRQVCLVADCKGWCAENLALVHQSGMRLLSRLPRNTTLHAQLLERSFQPQRIERPPASVGAEPDWYEIQGFDAHETITVAVTDRAGKTTSEERQVPVRAVRVYSSALHRRKERGIDATRARELREAARKIRAWESRAYACRSDAERALARDCAQHGFLTLTITGDIAEATGPIKRGRGRPPKNPEPAVQGRHYRISYQVAHAHHQTIAAHLRRAATFVLIRTAPTGWTISDAEMLDRYKDQYHVEHGFAWLKSTAAINPMFVELPRRIASLGFLYCIGLMVWSLMQRTVRKRLKELGKGLPYHRNKPSDRITTRFLFELFSKVQSIEVSTGQGPARKQVLGMDQWTHLACQALGCRANAYSPV